MKTASFLSVMATLMSGLLGGAPALWAQDQLVISEFMAANDTILADEDGQYSDWIEIYNAGTNTVNLNQWCLANSTKNLTKWRFPATNLAAYSYLVVFASNKDRTNAGAQLHTNFKLGAAGEYLALVRPDGMTVVSQYAPTYPAQQPDVSYGLGMVPGPSSILLDVGALARILVPSSDLGTTWTGVSFDDSAWSSGPTGVGFDRGTNYSSAIATDITAQMLNIKASAYLRVPFTVTDPNQFQELKLRLRYDDGFIAYVNGVEVFRTNAPGNATWNSAATQSHGSEPGGVGINSGLVPIEEFNISGFIPALRPGTNVLAIQGLNVAATNGDFLIVPQLVGRAILLQSSSHLYFPQPTPGALNASGVADIAPPPTFSLPGGIYTSNLVVTLSSPLSNAIIHFTLDGTVPTEFTPIYSGPIVVTSCVPVRAQAFALGYYPSGTKTEAYTLLDNNLINFSSPLPLVILDTYNQDVTYDMTPKAPGAITVIDIDPLTRRATPLGRQDLHGRAGISGHGQTAFCVPGEGNCNNKRSYNVEFWNELDGDNSVSVLGFPAGSDFVLASIYTDKTFMNDMMGMQLFADMGHYSVRRRYVEVFWNGWPPADGIPATHTVRDPSGKVGTNDYVGIYLLQEKVRIEPNRVNISTPQSGAPGDPITGGYMFKKDKLSPGDIPWLTTSGQSLLFYHPTYEQLTSVQRQWLMDYINQFESVLYGPNWRDPIYGYAQYIDVDSFVDMQWIVEFTKQIDGYRLSNYMYKDRGKKIHMEPIWDWDLSFGNCNYLRGGQTNGWYWNEQDQGMTPTEHIWLRRLMWGDTVDASNPLAYPYQGDPDFYQKFVDRWGELRQGVFYISNVLARVDAITNYMSEAIARDFVRWPRLGRYVWPNPNGAGDGRDVDYQNPTTYAGIMGQFKKWMVGRYTWLDSQFLTAPLLSRTNGPASAPLGIVTRLGVVYYTLDGSDPRLPGGQTSPNALLYTNFITLPPYARVFARAWYSNSLDGYGPRNGAWSPPAKADFGYPAPSLAITEVMYHPGDPPPGMATNDEEFEFIELMNTTASAIDLTGMRLAGGVDFVFPPVLVPTGAATTNDFDLPGTPYIASTLGEGPGASVVVGGPAGQFMRLVSQDTGTNRNRLAFDQTASGPYEAVTAEFDFRATNSTIIPPPVFGNPTLQDFDSLATNYAVYPASGANIPVVMPGDAGSQGQFMRITPDNVGNLGNAVYFSQTATGIYNTVMATFDFRFTAAGTPADGMGFVLLNTATYGTNRYPTGITAISEEPNFPNALGVGFDIYNNGGTADPNANHVSLHWNGAMVSPTPVTPSFSLVAGVFHRAQITIRFDSGNARVSVKLTPNVYGGGLPKTLYDNFLIPGVAPFQGRVAFGARTGGAYASHDIDNVNIQYANTVFPPAGGLSLVFLPTAKFGASGPGSTLSDFVDLPTLTNAFALNLDMHLLDDVNNVNLYWNGIQRANFYLTPTNLNLDGGVFHHAKVKLTRVPDGSLADVTLTPNIFGTPGAPITAISNLLITGFYPGDVRVELAGRSGGQNLGVDLDNLIVSYQKLVPSLLAAGARILVVKNRAAFESRYGTGLPIAGEYVGSLNNGGDQLILYGRYGEPILNFTYNNNWYPITDGKGFSLVSANPNAPANAWNYATNWRVSSLVGGSPGADDPAPPTFVPVLVNEALVHSDNTLVPGIMDAIELHNPSTNVADVSYWYLSDDFNTPKKYQIQLGTHIPAGGYQVFYETQFSVGPNGFALRAEGEAVYLFSANAAGDLTGYYHGFTYGAAEANVSLGRYVTSQGDEDLVAQITRTFGATNSGPRVGPIVISEVMYHPPEFAGGVDNSVHEFIELYNVTNAPVSLFDPAQPTNTWHLRDAVYFEFPPGTVIPPSNFVLVVSFDPAKDLGELSSFLSQYGLSNNVPLFGPYVGKLSNAGASVELAKPVEFGTNAGTTYVLVDKVKYSDNPPWPQAADGAGFSLQRRDVTQYGNDPINWEARPPTPNTQSFAAPAPTIVAQPANQTVFAGTTANLNVTTDAREPYRYQWRFNGGNLDGATNATLLLPNVQVSQAGNYQVVVLGSSNSTDSAIATLTVYQAATISVPPGSRTVWPGSNTTFAVSASGNGPIAYQWRFNNAEISGATNATYAITNVQPTHEADYTVAVSDAVGPVLSSPAHLTVITHPLWTVQPTNRTVVAFTNTPVNVTNVSAAFSSTPVRYQWRLNSTNLVGATNATLILTNVQPSNTGSYSVLATDSYGSITSSNTMLTVLFPPYIVQPLANQLAVVGDNVTFTVVVTNPTALPIGYRWRSGFNASNTKDLVILVLNDYTSSLTITNVQMPAPGVLVTNWTYLVFVTNTAWSAGYRSTATLTIVAPGDADGDGMSNRDEVLAGTDPLDPQSYLRIDADAISGGVILRFIALANRTYTVFSREAVTGAAWTKLTDVDAAVTNRTVLITNVPPGVDERYYRLSTPKASSP